MSGRRERKNIYKPKIKTVVAFSRMKVVEGYKCNLGEFKIHLMQT